MSSIMKIHFNINSGIHNWEKCLLVEDHRVPIVEVQITIPAGLWHKIDQELHLEESLSIMTFDPEGQLRGTSNTLALDFSVQNYDEYSLITASYLSGDTEKVQDHLLKIFGKHLLMSKN